MINAGDVTAVLLAAGRASRFGGDKLQAEIGGVAIGERAGAVLRDSGFARLILVVGPRTVVLAGFDVVRVAPGLTMSASIAAGVRAASFTRCDACLIALADMPFVPSRHFAALMAAHDGRITASSGDGRAMVPAIFDRGQFPNLMKLQGDQGARGLLPGAKLVPASLDELSDIDLREDLARFV